MASCTDEERALRSVPVLLLLLLLLALCASALGCATGVVRTQGHRIERVLHFERAASDGERLWLAYRSEIGDREGLIHGEAARAVVIDLVELAPDARVPVDAFPLERLDPRAVAWEDLRALPLRRESRGDEAALVLVGSEGFRLTNVPGAPKGALLRSAALTRRFLTPWSTPLLVPAAVWDVFWVPQLAFIGVPIFFWDP